MEENRNQVDRIDETKTKNESEQGDPEEKKSFFRGVLEWVEVLGVAALMAFLINTFILANSTIPTGSMENTILAGSRVFGSRLNYTFGTAKRDDIAIFIYGYQCKNSECGLQYRESEEGVCPSCGRADSENSVVYYVKRVIGEPGDHIEIKMEGEAPSYEITKAPFSIMSPTVRTGKLYVNGVAKDEWYLPEPMICDGAAFPEIDVTVPEGCYYMLGDNRNNSADARYWGKNNFVKEEKLIARVYVKYWPLNEAGLVK